MNKEILNGVIENVQLTNADYGCLTMWLTIQHQNGTQAFGGINLYNPKYKPLENHPKNIKLDYTGHFVWQVMKVTEVQEISEIKGKNIRVEIENNKISAIGHILNDIWFNPFVEYEIEN